jgi:hypothetical protein|tara:strand:- start:1388 stop:1567 length:180 start_codon:yes stop_codon:yes gene_type:complete
MKMNDTLRPKPIMDMNKQSKSIKIETPVGSIESDSGNHFLDLITIIIVVIFLRKFYNAT